MPVIVIDNLAREVPAVPGQSLLVSLLHEGQPIHTRCGGRARCGCCRVRIESAGQGVSPRRPEEEALLGAERSAAGWRLACQTYLLRDVTLYLPTAAELVAECSLRGSTTAPKDSLRERDSGRERNFIVFSQTFFDPQPLRGYHRDKAELSSLSAQTKLMPLWYKSGSCSEQPPSNHGRKGQDQAAVEGRQ